jgi:hypothetical protein
MQEAYRIALKELGVEERAGADHNPRILEYHQATSLKATVAAKGLEGEVQFTPDAAFRTALENVKTALSTAKTAVGAVQLPLP